MTRTCWGRIAAAVLLLAVGVGLQRLNHDRALNDQLSIALANNDLQEVSHLLEEGADVRTQDLFGRNALAVASMMGEGCLAEEVLARGADVNGRNGSGMTALVWASQSGPTDVAETLLAQGEGQRPRQYGPDGTLLCRSLGTRGGGKDPAGPWSRRKRPGCPGADAAVDGGSPAAADCTRTPGSRDPAFKSSRREGVVGAPVAKAPRASSRREKTRLNVS